MITAILIMLWLWSCAVCVIAGYLAGKRNKKSKTVAPPQPSEQERKRFEREMREMENFFAYDGSEQTEALHTRSV
jgi:hypothetical protein